MRVAGGIARLLGPVNWASPMTADSNGHALEPQLSYSFRTPLSNRISIWKRSLWALAAR